MNSTMNNRIRRALSSTRLSARVLVAVALAGAITAACDVHGVAAPGILTSITVTPNATLVAGSTQQMIAVGYDADVPERVLPISPTWSVAAGGGTVSSTGLFTAGLVPGFFGNTVKATVGGISANASITVIPGALATITVTPNPITLAVATTQQFIAVGKDAAGNVVQFTGTWTIVAGGGSIDQNGIFTAGGAAGTYANTIQASNQGIKGFATVIVTVGPLSSIVVTPNPATLIVGTKQQFVAAGKDAGGNSVPIAATWSVVAGGGTVDGAGLFTAGAAPGTFTNTVKATNGTLSGTATVVVTAGPLATILVTPNPATVTISGTQQFTAVGSDANGNPVAISPTWAIVANGGTIDVAGGLFTAGTVTGTFTNTVKATSGALSGTATVNVTSGPLASITVTPNPVSMLTNTPQQFVAVGKDASGNLFVMSPVWSVVNGGGVINSTGMFTSGAAAGTFANTIRATSGTLSGTATVVVTTVPLATITVTPNPATIAINGVQQFTAAGSDISGNPIAIAPTWTVVTGGGTITATGQFTAGTVSGTFINTVRASLGGLSGFATVIVTTGPLASITVSPNPVTMPTNTLQPFTALGKDASGNIFVMSPVWSVVNGGGVINSITGAFTSGGAAGTFLKTIQATSGAISGTADVTVTAVAPPPLVDFGVAAPNGIMAGASVTCSGTGVIHADISISPGSTISGFPPCTRTGVLHLGDATALQGQNALTAAYNTLFGQTCPAGNNFGTVDYASKTLPAGVYCSGSTINVTGTLTLNGGGDPNATFVFQAGSALIGAANIVLIGNAQAKNVYWVVGSSATLNSSAWQGNIVALTSIDLKVNSTLLGRALARNGSVSLDASANVITLP